VAVWIGKKEAHAPAVCRIPLRGERIKPTHAFKGKKSVTM